MAALVQTLPQQTGTVTMLQTRPTSAGGMLPAQGQTSSPYTSAQQPRSSFYGGGNSVGGVPTMYRSSTGPIQPYAFTSTPNLNTPGIRQQPQPHRRYVQQGGVRPSSTAPSLPRMQSFDGPGSLGRVDRIPSGPSMSNAPSTVRYVGSRDDSSLPGQGTRRVSPALRPQSAYLTGSTPQLSYMQTTPVRHPPERYRRSMGNAAPQSQQKQPSQGQTSAPPSGYGMASVGHLYGVNGGSNVSLPEQRQSMPRSQTQHQLSVPRRNSFRDSMLSGLAADDIQLHRQHLSEDTKRFRRRSMPTLNASEYLNGPFAQKPLRPNPEFQRPPATRSSSRDAQQAAPTLQRPLVLHNKGGSCESVSSGLSSGSRPSSTNRNTPPTDSTSSPATSIVTNQTDCDTAANNDTLRLVNIPPRISSDAANRLGNAAPASKAVAMNQTESTDAALSGSGADVAQAASPSVSTTGRAASPTASSNGSVPSPAKLPSHLESPAMRHLSAINQKGGRLRSKTSKLRRAFSFGSVADFRKTSGPDEDGESGSPSNKLQKDPSGQDVYDAEQARIAQQQEEAGIGNSIYAGVKIFSGSTDNLSISSTASSASIMIRKMGRGMKKSTRSLVGLFRPKSIVGVPAADEGAQGTGYAPLSGSTAVEATVSMVTVEAERDHINDHGDVHGQTSDGAGLPRLDGSLMDGTRGSLNSDRLGSSGTENSGHRKSIIEGDKERAEALAAVRKGILKNTSGSSSPSRSPLYELHNPPAIGESPASSAPSTPTDDIQGHKRTGSVALGGEDYFVSALRLRQCTKSGSSTPQGSMKRNATFSPRIVFYDTWPSQEYDRRGEIATCNRLTPMLAQQIKEELNNFKMEMEVHENSKIYTHFF